MDIQLRVHEKFLYDIWRDKEFEKEIITESGDKIEILDCGVLNENSAGPDFVNARIKIGNLTYVGDVEIDLTHADWRRHGHHLNKRFNKVILHATLKTEHNHNYVFTQDGRKVQSISFASFLKKNLRDELQKIALSQKEQPKSIIACYELTPLVSEQMKAEYLENLGLERFKIKCERMILRLKEFIFLKHLSVQEPIVRYEIPKEYFEQRISVDDLYQTDIWQQLLYESIFEALGYSQNKGIMLKLAQAVTIPVMEPLQQKDNFIHSIEAFLFKVSGLLPEEGHPRETDSSDYLRFLYESWNEMKDSYDGEFFDLEQWNFFRLRPQNFPTIRIAAGARIIDSIVHGDLIGILSKKFVEIHNIKVLKNSVQSLFIQKAEGYWAKHYVFDEQTEAEIKYFVGSNRADEILLNVVLPFMYIYFDLFGKSNFARKVIRVLRDVDFNVENSLVKELAEALGLKNGWKHTLAQQGMLELFRKYCSKNKCEECKIGQSVFAGDQDLTCEDK